MNKKNWGAKQEDPALPSCQSDFCSISDISENYVSATNTDKTLQFLLTEMGATTK